MIPPGAVSKKVIYIDQCLLSRLVKMLDPAIPEIKKNKPQFDLEFLEKVFSKLHRLVKLQLIVCPESPFHYDESSVLDPEKPAAFSEHKRIWELLSSGVHFKSSDNIRDVQILHDIELVAKGEHDSVLPLNMTDAVSGNLDSWPQMRVHLSLNWNRSEDDVTENRQQTEMYRNSAKRLYGQWKANPQSFEEVYKQECLVLGIIAQHRLAELMATRLEMLNATTEAEFTVKGEKFFRLGMGAEVQLLQNMARILGENGLPIDEAIAIALLHLKSIKIARCPYVNISCSIYAEISQRVIVANQNIAEMPFYDVSLIAAYLPYCDAMFIDREMHGLLGSKKVVKSIKGYGRVFSAANKSEFLDYLDEVLNSAPDSHLNLVRARFGKTWEEPYFDVLKHDRARASKGEDIGES